MEGAHCMRAASRMEEATYSEEEAKLTRGCTRFARCGGRRLRKTVKVIWKQKDQVGSRQTNRSGTKSQTILWRVAQPHERSLARW